MYCTKCGAELTAGAKFCTKCGQPVNTANNNSQPLNAPNMPRAPKAPQPMMPKAPIASPQPNAPRAPQPVSPTRPSFGGPQPPRPMAPKAPQAPTADDKGFMTRVGHGIASAVTGGSFSQGYEQQRQRENNLAELLKSIPARINDAKRIVKELEKAHPGMITNSDELDVIGITNKLQEFILTNGANENAIKKALKELDDKIYELRTKCDSSLSQNQQTANDDARLRDRNVPVIQLHDVNEDELAVVGKKAIWGIQPGQIARRVTERELDAVEGLNGFIIRDGCQAMIFVNGELVEIIDEGAYQIPQRSDELMKAEFQRLFDEMDRQDKEKKEEERIKQDNRSFIERGGVVGMVGRGFRHVADFIFGAVPVKQKKERSEAERIKDIEDKINRALKAKNRETVLSVVLVRKGLINLTFGGIYDGDTIKYEPYTIPTRMFDVRMGVSMRVSVTDIRQLAMNYLADRNSFTTNDLFQTLNQSVEEELAEVMRNTEYSQEGLSVELRNHLKERLLAVVNNHLQGLVCEAIDRITDKNEDFERFRQVERELYCSEKELDYMQRTGEMRNRMELEQNRQLINAARNKEEYAHAMQQIDKDGLLHQDEWDDFVRLLESQRKIKEAKSEEEVYEALADLKKNRLVKDDEMAALTDALEHNRINRNQITEVMRIQANENISMADMKARFALGDYNQNHEWEREDLARKRTWGIEDEERERQWLRDEREYDRMRGRQKSEDDYDFEVMMRQRAVDIEDHDRERRERLEDENRQRAYARQDKFDDADLLERKANNATDRLMRMMEAERMAEAQKQQHEQNLASISANEQMNRDNNFANMTAEQIRAAQLSHLTGDAQVAMANSYNSEKENELRAQQQAEQKALYEQMLAQQNSQNKENKDFMLQMAQMMQQGMMATASSNMANQQQQFQQQQQYQQQRYDDQVAMKDEYRQNAMHQQERIDHNQDQALSNIGQVSTAAANNLGTFNCRINDISPQANPVRQNSPSPQTIECKCYNCQKIIHIPEGAACCPECGAPFQW